MTGVTFRRCNLDNVCIPPGNTVGPDCTHKRIKPFPGTPRKDKPDELCSTEDWFCDDKGNPVEPLRKAGFEEEGRSTNPKDMPADHIIEINITKAEYDKLTPSDWTAPVPAGDGPLAGKAAWFREVPQITRVETSTRRVEMEKARWQAMQAEGDNGDFDQQPTLLAERKRPAGRLRVPDRVRNLLSPERLAEMQREIPAVTVVQLEGDVTTYTVRGKAWLYRGQTAEEVA